MRKFLMLLATSVAMLVVSAGSALAQEYPPAPPGPGEAVVTPGAPGAGAGAEGPGLAITGSNTLLLVWIGLAVLMVGIVLYVASRRRRAIRERSVTAAIA
jgi:LPXTG-motif cell wall-anchored protein